MKKWNKKIYIFFSLFFMLSLLAYPSVLVFAGTITELDTEYEPSEIERQCYYECEGTTFNYDSAFVSKYFYGSNGSIVVGWLEKDANTGDIWLWISPLGNFRSPESEKLYSVQATSYYSESDGLAYCETNRNTDTWYDTRVGGAPYETLLDEGKTFHMRIFNSYESAKSFALTGDESGLISDSSSLTDSNSVYSPDIGYLQNVTFNSRNVGSDNSDLNNMTYYFSYDSVTNTGFDINQDGVRVSFYSTYKGIYYDSWAKYFKKDGNIKRFDNKILQVSANGSDRLEFSYEACMQSHAREKAETEAMCDSSVPTFGQIEYWLRIEQKQSDGTWRYGGWVNCSNQSTSVQGDSIADDCVTQTYDGNGNLDVDGGYGSGNSTPHTYGEGSTMDSADADAIENENHKRAFESIEDFGDGLELMKVQLGNIPKVIAEVFLALPSALIVAITSGFFVCIVLRILGR